MTDKPLGGKAYGHIPHLPGSRVGPGDHKIGEGQARILTERTRDRHDHVFVEEKLDGSCVSVARVDGKLFALTRAGYEATTSKYAQHMLWDEWFWDNYARFDALLQEGERIVGEWLAQAHGTRYDLTCRDPFAPFDIMTGITRLPREQFWDRVKDEFDVPALVCEGATSIEAAMELLGERGMYGALDPVEGCVWRVERRGVVDFLAKFVRPDKVDGSYLETLTGGEAVWNWRP